MINLNPVLPKGIVWLASFPKSGNTWLRAFLYALKKVRTDQPVDAIDLDELAFTNVSDRMAGGYVRYLSGPATAVDKGEVAAARPKVQRDIAQTFNDVVYIKTHNALTDDRGWPTINLGVSIGAIYLVRNPLDVAVSWAAFRGVPVDTVIADMERERNETDATEHDVHMVLGSWSENVRSWTGKPSPRVLVVRYEDLLEDPMDSFSAIARHLVVRATPAQVSQAIRLSSFETLHAQELASGFAEKPPEAEMFFRRGKAGQWKEVLKADQVARIVAAHGEEMRQFGYLEADGSVLDRLRPAKIGGYAQGAGFAGLTVANPE